MFGDWINGQVVQSLLRWLSDKVGLYIIAQGWFTGQEWVTLSGGAITFLVLVFSVISARTKAVAISEAGGKEAVKAAIKDRAIPQSLV